MPLISGIIGAAAHVVDSIASPPSGCMGLFLRFLRAPHPRCRASIDPRRIARNRYRLFGRNESCLVPTSAIAARGNGPQPLDDLSCVFEPTHMGVAGSEIAVRGGEARILLDCQKELWLSFSEALADK